MLRWFRRTCPSFYARAERQGVERAADEVVQQLHIGRTASISALASSRWLATLSAMSRCPGSIGPQGHLVRHKPPLPQAIPKDGFRALEKVTDEGVRLAQRYQGYGGTRFVEDDLAGDPEASNGQGPPSITDCLIGAGAAGLAAAQAFRSQLLQDATKHVRAERWSTAWRRPLRRRRSWRSSEVGVAVEGVGGAFGYLGGLAEGAVALVGIAGSAACGLARGTGWVLENKVRQQHE